MKSLRQEQLTIVTAATVVTQAAQPAITSVGTLTSLTVSGNLSATGSLTINANRVSMSASAVANAFEFDSSSNLKLIGTTGATTNNLQLLSTNTTAQLRFVFNNAGTYYLGIGSDASGAMIFGTTASIYGTTPTVRMTLGQAGGLAVSGALSASGAFGVNGSAVQGKYTVNAASTDLATAIALVNQLRAAIIANGICI